MRRASSSWTARWSGLCRGGNWRRRSRSEWAMARIVLDDRGRKQRIPPPAASYGMARIDSRQALLERARAELAGVHSGLWSRTGGALVLGIVLGLLLYNEALSALG